MTAAQLLERFEQRQVRLAGAEVLDAAAEHRDLRAFVGVLPFFHIYGMLVILNFALMRGATILLAASLIVVIRIDSSSTT